MEDDIEVQETTNTLSLYIPKKYNGRENAEFHKTKSGADTGTPIACHAFIGKLVSVFGGFNARG